MTNWVATLIAAIPFLWMLAIELGTSRKASRKPDPGDLELETRTGKLVDLGAAIALVGGLISSLWLPSTVIGLRLPVSIAGTTLMAIALILSAILSQIWCRRRVWFPRCIHLSRQVVACGPLWLRPTTQPAPTGRSSHGHDNDSGPRCHRP